MNISSTLRVDCGYIENLKMFQKYQRGNTSIILNKGRKTNNENQKNKRRTEPPFLLANANFHNPAGNQSLSFPLLISFMQH